VKTSIEVAEQIVKLYGRDFGGKRAGKFRLSQKRLLTLGDRKSLRDAFVEELTDELLERGCVLVDLRGTVAKNEFAVISIRYVDNMRPLSRSAIEGL
jgi:hypothetical protein